MLRKVKVSMIIAFPPSKHINIANLITSASIGLSLLTLIMATNQKYVYALTLLGITIILDGLDGTIARMANNSSIFGKELDGFADALNFCLVPAYISYHLGLESAWEIMVLLIFLVTGIWRITNYNITEMEQDDKGIQFIGLITTAVAALFVLLSSLILENPFVDFRDELLAVFLLISSILMVSGIRYNKYGMLTIVIFSTLPFSLWILWF